MAVSNNFSSSTLDLNGVVGLAQPTALVWGPDGRLYVTENGGKVTVLTVGFGDPDPTDDDASVQFHVTDAETITLDIQNHNDDGTQNTSDARQVTGIDVTRQYDAGGNQLYTDAEGNLTTVAEGNTPAVTMYVSSSDMRVGAGGSGADVNLDTNSGVVTRLEQTGTDAWDQVDILRGLPRNEENHSVNGMEVIQTFDDAGKLVGERMILASGGNANNGAPSNNFAGQQEQPLSAAILELDLTGFRAEQIKEDGNGRPYILDLPTLNDPTREGTGDNNDPAGGNDGLNSAKLTYGGLVTMYSPGYRNAYDVEVTEDGRVWTYDNGANGGWGGRPIGEAGDNGGTTDNAQDPDYISTNLNSGDGNASDGINLENWGPSNNDQFHEITRSDDLSGRDLSVGGNGPVTTYEGPDGLTYVYGGHPNPSRAEGAKAGLLFTPEAGTENAFLLVSSLSSYDEGTDDYDQVIAWLEEVEGNPNNVGAGDLTKKVIEVDPGKLYDIYSMPDGSGVAVEAGGSAPEGGTYAGQSGLPSDVAEMVDWRNPVEGDYKEAGRTDGALDSGKGSINGLAEYTSTIMDEGGVKMSGAILASVFNSGDLIIMGRNEDGSMSSTGGTDAMASDRAVFQGKGQPLGLATVGDNYAELGLSQAFQGSVWSAVYGSNDQGQFTVYVEVLQPNNGKVPLAGAELIDPNDRDQDGITKFGDPFEYSNENGYALEAGQKITLDFNPNRTDYDGSINGTGLLGAALDGPSSEAGPLSQGTTTENLQESGATANQDARTGKYLDNAGDNLGPDTQADGLFDLAGNIIPGGNAPILQIKEVVPGTMVGAANTARDALHTGIRPAADVSRIVSTVTLENWVASNGGVANGQVSGMVFGDGTQSNFLRFVYGEVDGEPGIEIGMEIGDAGYTVLASLAVPALLMSGNNTIDLRLEIDMADDFAIGAAYRLGNASALGDMAFTEIDLGDAALPEGVLRDVLTGDHTIDGTQSGAAIGIVAETSEGNALKNVDIYNIDIEGFGNEIDAADAAAANAATGTAGDDTIRYTGNDTAPVTLAQDIENIDASGSTGDFAITGNDGANIITVGAGQNNVTTGRGADTVRGTAAHLDGTDITDFAENDRVVISDGSVVDMQDVTYEAGSAIVNVGGSEITFSGPEFDGFDPANGPATFQFQKTDEGVIITRAPAEVLVKAIAAGGTSFTYSFDASGNQVAQDDPNAVRTVTFDSDAAVETPGDTGDAANYVTPGSDGTGGSKIYTGEAPSQGADYGPNALDGLHGAERSSNQDYFGYEIPELADGTYRVDLYIAEIYHGVATGTFNEGDRVFDISVEGETVANDFDLWTAADGQSLKEVKLSFTAEVTDGAFTIDFDARPGAGGNDQPKISGLALYKLDPGAAFVDGTAPEIASIDVSNPQSVQDGTRTATVVVTDAGGFDAAAFEGLDGSELSFTGIVPATVSTPSVTLSEDGKTATLVYELEAEGNAWPAGQGEISLAAGTFTDAAGNGSAAANGAFILQPNLSQLVKGDLALAINVGPTTNGTADLDGDNDTTYGGAITNDTILGIDLQADDPSYYSPSSKTGSNIDGLFPGSNPDLDGSALHTYRDSANGSFTATYPIENGTYVVELHFAELYFDEAGQRQGDYTINGENWESNFDAFATAGGGDTPTSISKTITVTDGQIVIDVNADAGQPGWNAIVIWDAVDSNAAPQVSVSDVTVAESDDAQITFTRSGNTAEAITVEFTVADGTATEGQDYTAPETLSVIIEAGATSVTVAVPTLDDDQEESAETFTVDITSVSQGAEIAKGTGTVTIAANDTGLQIPAGGTLLDLDFETDGTPLAEGGFDRALGGDSALDTGVGTSVSGGKLIVNTSNGDLSQAASDASKNDFVRDLDLSNDALTEVYVTTRMDNPFPTALAAQNLPTDTVPNYAQQGLVIATGDGTGQDDGKQVKLVFGGNQGAVTQLWSAGASGLDQIIPLTDISAAADTTFGLTDIAKIELSMAIDKANETVAQVVTFFDASGAVLGGVRPAETAGFATAAPQPIPADVLAAIQNGTSTVGVTSTDFDAAMGSFEASWDFVTVTSPQAVDSDTAGPTASVSLTARDMTGDPIVVTVVYDDTSDVDGSTVDTNDVILSGPTAAAGVTVAFDAATNTATYTFAAPDGGWMDGDYTAATVAGEVADLSAASNTNAGGDSATSSFAFEAEPQIVALNDTFKLPEDSVAVPLAVLVNDTVTEGATLSISEIGTPSHGTAEIVNGEILYTPDTDYVGADSFTYTVTNGTESETATISLTTVRSHEQPQSTSHPENPYNSDYWNADEIAPELSPSGKGLVLTKVAVIPNEAGNGAAPRMNSFDTVGERIFISTEGTLNNSSTIYELVDDGQGGRNVEVFFDVGQAYADGAADGRILSNEGGPIVQQGLRGIAFHPDFEQNGKLYTSISEARPENTEDHPYLSDVEGEAPLFYDSVVIEWTLGENGQIDPDSYREVFRIGNTATGFNHPVRQIEFNPHAEEGDADYGLLYVATGDGTWNYDSQGDNASQNNDGLGKILRLDPTEQVDGTSYGIPVDNPFVGDGSMNDAVYALGFRNPGTIDFAKGPDGQTVILTTSVGFDNFEEVNLIQAGGNYGWPYRAGPFSITQGGGNTTGVQPLGANDADLGLVYPVTFLAHDPFDAGEGIGFAGDIGSALTGGTVIQNGSELDGEFIFADFAENGRFFHVSLEDLLAQKIKLEAGESPDALTFATPSELTLFVDHDNDPTTTPIVQGNFKDVLGGQFRTDVRFGQGPDGELWVMNKRNGEVYVASNTLEADTVNDAPRAVLVSPVLTAIEDIADTSAAIKVANITVIDDSLGTNTLSLGGTDADLFEIVGRELFLKAGVSLDSDSVPSLDVTVEVNDAMVGGNVDAFKGFTLSVIPEQVTDPADMDGDGLLNGADPAALDAENGLGTVLTAGQTISLDFSDDTANPLDGTTGLTGVQTSAGFTAGGVDDPYGAATTDSAVVSDGNLVIQSSEGDVGGNASLDNYQTMVDVSGQQSVTFETKFANPFDAATPGFALAGMQIGTGTQNDFMKVIFISFGNGLNIQVAQQVSGEKISEMNTALGDLLATGFGIGDIADVAISVDFDRNANALTPVVSFLDANGAEIGGKAFDPVTPGTNLLAALNGQNPATNGAGGVAVGFDTSDIGAAPSFLTSFDYLRVTSNDIPAGPPSVALSGATTVTEGDNGTTDVVYTVTLSHMPSADTEITVDLTSVTGGGATNPADVPGDVAFADGSTSQTLTFTPGGPLTQTVTVAVTGETDFEKNEVFSIALDTDLETTAKAQKQIVVTVNNDDPEAGNSAPVASPIDAGTALESDDSVSIDLLEGAEDADGDPLTVANVVVTDASGADVAFILAEGSTLVIDPAQFAYDLNAGDSSRIDVRYDILDGKNNVTPNTATLTIEGEGNPVDDVDNDGILNGADPAAYDAQNGMGNVLGAGETINLGFDTAANPLGGASGLTGAMVSPNNEDFGPYDDAADPYGSLTTDTARIEGGALVVTSTAGDVGGNTSTDNYQTMVDVSGQGNVTFSTKFANPFTSATSAYSLAGLTIGAGTQDDLFKIILIKFEDGFFVQTAAENSAVVSEDEDQDTELDGLNELELAGLMTGDAGIDDIADVVFSTTFDRSANTLTPEVTFLDGAGTEIGGGTLAPVTPSGSLLAALNGENPVTGNTGGVAVGIDTSNVGNDTSFETAFDYLRVTSNDEPVVDTAPVVTLTDLVAALPENASTAEATVVAGIAVEDDGLSDVTLTLNGVDSDLFELSSDQSQLLLKAGVALDHETAASLDVAVLASDAAGTSTAELSLAVTDVNEAPQITITPVVDSIAEDADLSEPTKVADIAVTDDALGSVELSLTGDDAGLFELSEDGTALLLKAGADLNGAGDMLDVTVVATDPDLGAAAAEAVLGLPVDTADRAVTDILFSVAALESYSNQDDAVSATVSEDGETLTMEGNAWKRLALDEPLTVTPDMALRFTFSSDKVGEIIGIGFDDNNDHMAERTSYQFGGNQILGSQLFQNAKIYGQNDLGSERTFTIRLDDLVGRTFTHMTFISDKDNGAPDNEAIFSNVQLLRLDLGTPGPELADDVVQIEGTENEITIDPVSLLANDAATEGDLMLVDVGDPTGGTVRLEDGVIYVTPDGSGAVSFSYTAEDELGGSSTATVELNRAPQTASDTYEVPEGQILYINGVQLLRNDTDVDGDALSLVSVGDATGGTVTLDDEGQVVFVPANGFTGTASFTYEISDGAGGVATGTATVAVESDVPSQGSDIIVFDEATIGSYSSGQDTAGTTVANGTSLSISGNAWKQVDIGRVTVGEGWVLNFTVDAADAGEILAIGFDSDNQFQTRDTQALFQLGGSQGWASNSSQAFRAYEGGSGPVTFSIPLDGLTGQTVDRLVFIGDDDVDGSFAATFSDISFGPATAPSLEVPIADQTATEDETFVFAIPEGTFADMDGDVLSTSFAGEDGTPLPAWLTDNGDGTLSGTPTQADVDAGLVSIVVTATDGMTSVVDTFVLDVVNVNDAPETAGAIPDANFDVADGTSIVLPEGLFADEDGDALTLSAATADGALPEWLIFDAETGTFTVAEGAAMRGRLSIVVTATDLSGETTTADFTLEATGAAQEGDVLFRLNAFGPAVAATDGGPDWQAGSAYLTATDDRGDAFDGYTGDPDAVPAGVPLSVLGTARSSDDPFSYAIPAEDLAGEGNYVVRLYVAELYGPNQEEGVRNFDVSVEGATAGSLDDIDPTAGVGAGDLKVIEYNVAVTDGVLDIGFLQDVSDNPIVNAIEILKGPDELSNTAPEVSGTVADAAFAAGAGTTITLPADLFSDADGDELTLSAALEDGPLPEWLAFDPATGTFTVAEGAAPAGGVTVTVTATDPAGTSASTSFDLTSTAEPVDSDVVFRLNAFGDAVAATDGGPAWLADGAYLSTTDDRGDTFGYSGDPDAIPAGVPAAVLDTARSSDDPFSYSIPVTELAGDGNYIVNLYVAELFGPNQTGGKRNFDVSVEGVTTGTLNNIDPSEGVGAGDVKVISYEVTVTDGALDIGFLQDIADNPIINAVEIIEGGDGTTVDGPQDPTEVRPILSSLDDVDAGASYDDAAVGAVQLTVNAGLGDVQVSNYGDNSFVLTNLGNKEVAAVAVDFRNAVYKSAVVDPSGSAGDDVLKPFQVDNDDGTGAFFASEGIGTYLFPGADPLPNDTGTGQASTGGYRGILMRFDGSEGGFSAGETVGFAGDMDTNTIAGLLKSGPNGVDTNALSDWDIGGVSGAELIGSSFTVMFDDGTYATGVLHGDGSQAGSIGAAVQNQAERSVDLAINGTGSDVQASYGGTEPEIALTGTAGDTVRVVMTKGFNPVANDANGIADLVADRLDDQYSTFLANNAFDVQTYDVVIGADGTATLPKGAFDYVNQTSGEDVANAGTAPLSFTAAVIDPQSKFALGPVNTVYAVNNGTPVASGDPGVVFQGQGGEIVMEAERAVLSSRSGWQFETVEEGANENPDPRGEGYLIYEGGDAFLNPNGNSVLNYRFETDEAGEYTLKGLFGRRVIPEATEANDVWVRLLDAEGNPLNPVPQNVGGGELGLHVKIGERVDVDTEEFDPENVPGGSNVVLNNADKWMKFYASGVGLDQLSANGFNGDNGGIDIDWLLDANSEYSLQISGRSDHFEIDRWALSKGDANSAAFSAPESPIRTNDSVPTVVEPIADQRATIGEAFSFTIPDGTFDDLDGDDLVVDLSAPEGLAVEGRTVSIPEGTPAGTYTIVATATDGDGNAVTDTFDIVVGERVAEATIVTAADDVELGSGLNSPDLETNQTIQLRFTVGEGMAEVSSVESALVSWVSERAHGGDATLTFQLEDSLAAEGYGPGKSFVGEGTSVAVSGGWGDGETITDVVDLAPLVNALIASQGPLSSGDTLNVQITGTGATRFIEQTSPVITFDGLGTGRPNRAPTGDQTDLAATAGTIVSIDLGESFSDPDAGDTLSYAVEGLPAGLTLEGGIISGTPTEAGLFEVAVTVSDGTATFKDNFVLDVAPEPEEPEEPVAENVSATIVTAADDVELGSGLNSPDLETNQTIQLRFTVGEGMAEVSSVESALVSWVSERAHGGDATLTFQLEDSLAAEGYGPGKSFVGEGTSVAVSGGWGDGETITDVVDLAPLVNALIASQGPLSSGDTLNVQITGTGATRFIEQTSPVITFDGLGTGTPAPTPTPTPDGQTPFGGTVPVLGESLVLQGGEYDEGGQGVAYNDTPGLQGPDGPRADEVETKNGGDIAYTAPGEWLEYTFTVEEAGLYDLSLVAARGNNGSSDLTLDFYRDGIAYVSAGTTVNQTANWETFGPTDPVLVDLEAGEQTLRVTFEDGTVDLRSISFDAVAPENASPVAAPIDEVPVVEEGETFSFDVAPFFTDPDGDTLGFTAVGLPAGLSISPSGLISGTLGDIDEDSLSTITITASDGVTETAQDFELDLRAMPTPTPDGQTPFGGTVPVLGESLVLQGGEYDEGGQGVAYNDTPGLQGPDGPRADEVETKNGGDIAYTAPGEWLEYTFTVEEAGLYDLSLVAARGSRGSSGISFDIFQNGSIVSSTKAAVSQTANWNTFAETGAGSVELPTGEQTLRVTFDTGTVDLRSLSFSSTNSPSSAQTPFGGTAPVLGDQGLSILATSYDEGGQGIAYNDSNAGAVGGSDGARIDDVEVTPQGGDIGYIGDGEWYEYTIDVAEDGTYELDMLLALGSRSGGARSVNVQTRSVDTDDVLFETGAIGNGFTGSWTDFAERSAEVELEEGVQILRFEFDGGSQNFRSFDLSLLDDPSV